MKFGLLGPSIHLPWMAVMCSLRMLAGARGAFLTNHGGSGAGLHDSALNRSSLLRRGFWCASGHHGCQPHSKFSERNCSLRGRFSRHIVHMTSYEKNDDTDTSLSRVEKSIQSSLCSGISPFISQSTEEIVLLLGVSAGCDSVGLFHGLIRVLSPTGDISSPFSLNCDERHIPCSVHVAHFDHQRRASESDGDRIFVEELCAQYGVPFHCYYWDKNASMNENTTFSQDTARLWRRTCMSQLVRQVASEDNHSGFILTAHHADDSLESMLLKLLRGTHITNIKGMDSITRDADGNWIVRPCLGLHKSEIVEYLLTRTLTWREDSSNASNKYLRNRVRNDLIPLLSELVGGDEVLEKRAENLSRQSQQVSEDLHTRATRYLQETDTDECFVLPTIKFELVHKEALHIWLQQRSGGCQFSYDNLERVCDQLVDYPDSQEWKVNIGQGWDVVREGGIVRLVHEQDEPATTDAVEVEWSVVSKSGFPTDNMPAGMDLFVSTKLRDEMGGIFVNKVRYENLPFTPPWRKGRSPTSAAEFLRGQKVPLQQRRDAAIMYIIRRDKNKTAVAVKVPTKGDWVLDASVAHDTQVNGAERIFVILPDD